MENTLVPSFNECVLPEKEGNRAGEETKEKKLCSKATRETEEIGAGLKITLPTVILVEIKYINIFDVNVFAIDNEANFWKFFQLTLTLLTLIVLC